MSLRLELHKLISFSSSIINGDEFGGQKISHLGGVPRARHSSQSVLRSIDMARALFDVEVGLWHRNFHVGELLKSKLEKEFGGAEAELVAQATAKVIGVRGKRQQDGDTNLSLLTCDCEIDEIAKILKQAKQDGLPVLRVEEVKGKRKADGGGAKEEEKAKGSDNDNEKGPKLDKDLAEQIKKWCRDFNHAYLVTRGRFVAGGAEVTRLACRFAAHGIGTTPYRYEPDFANAYDDLTKKVEWMGHGELASMVMYYNYVYDVLEAYRRLRASFDKEKAIAAVIHEAIAEKEAFASAMPLARCRSTAPFSPPSLFIASVVSGGQPINYGTAFDTPCTNLVDSAARIDSYAAYCAKNFYEAKPDDDLKKGFEGLSRVILSRGAWGTKECIEQLSHFDHTDRAVLRENTCDALTKFLRSIP